MQVVFLWCFVSRKIASYCWAEWDKNNTMVKSLHDSDSSWMVEEMPAIEEVCVGKHIQ